MKLVIIGTGLAGYMLAKEWRKLDGTSELIMITESRGDFYSKPLLSTALTQKKSAEELAITSATEMAEQLKATILTKTRVKHIDARAKTLTVDEAVISYDVLVLALGAKPISLTLQGNASAELLSVNDLEAYAQLRAHLVQGKKQVAIIGSGLVGCEFANDLLNVGMTLEMISLEQYPLARLVPESIGRVLQTAFAARGVTWHFDVAASALNRAGKSLQLQLSNGKTVQTDMVLSAVGLVANTDLARIAGLKVQRGICVNRQLQTSEPHIYALGDCAEVEGQLLQYVAPLLLCSKVLAKHLAGEAGEVDYPPMPIVVKTPACPIASLLVPADLLGQWECSGEGLNQRALFYDAQKQLRGFALSGDCVRERFALLK